MCRPVPTILYTAIIRHLFSRFRSLFVYVKNGETIEFVGLLDKESTVLTTEILPQSGSR
jgi:hypothetical protein